MFRKTDCYHYFHTHCLQRYVSYHHRLLAEEEEEREREGVKKVEGERVLECPVCRDTIPNGKKILNVDHIIFLNFVCKSQSEMNLL